MKRVITKYQKVSYESKVIKERFTIDKPYKRIWQIAKDFNANIPTRKGFGFLDSGAFKRETAVWCINIDDDSLWEDILQDNGNTLIVRNVKDKSASDLQNRIRKSPDVFHVNVKRLTFKKAQKNGFYTFLGVFMLSAIDFDNLSLIFRRVSGNCVIVTKTEQKKVIVTYEEDTIIQTN